MLILAIKLLLVPVPVLLAAITLAARRWGHGLAGWLGSFPVVAGPVLLVVTLEQGANFGAAAAEAGLAPLFLNAPGSVSLVRLPNRLELPARMGVGVLLVFVTSALATAFGPRLAGYTALFPLVGSVVASFTHALHGRDPTLRFLTGMARGLWSVTVFLLVLALALPWAGVAVAFGGALLATLAFHLTLRPTPL